MDDFSPSDLKTILHSKRANLYYLEHCRVLVNGGRVEYVTDEGKHSLYWNIPIANTTSVMLGTGTSITQAAMRELAKAGVMVGFCGGGGTPLFSANEMDVEVAWFPPQSEYRPTEYLLTAWAPRPPGFWACPTDLPSCMARTGCARRCLRRGGQNRRAYPHPRGRCAVPRARGDEPGGQVVRSR